VNGLSKRQIMMVVNKYIGVSGGYLGDFSYRTHAEFYPEFCDLDIDPSKMDGTTRERFIKILSSAHPPDQAKILRGVIERFPLEAEDRPSTRTPEIRANIEQMIDELLDGPRISSPTLALRCEMAVKALSEAEVLMEKAGASSAIDRVHTALHSYLSALCVVAEIEVADDPSLTVLLKALRKEHPALAPTGPRSGDIDKILRSFSNVLDTLNPLRNRASMAHPQNELLDQPEAMLVIHATRTVLHYLNARMQQSAAVQIEPEAIP